MKEKISLAVEGLVILMLLLLTLTQAGEITGLRQYEPVVVTGGRLSQFYDVPIDDLFLYKYDKATSSWTMMPFQIDERTYGPVPETSRKRWYYFIPEEWTNIDSIQISSHEAC